jgi:DNA-binding HxlR family transcriptional regulator
MSNNILEKMKMCEKRNRPFPIEYTLSIIGGQWKLMILYYLTINNVMRYGELKKSLTGITHKMLSMRLKEMEEQEIIVRVQYNQIPPKVEYSLSEKGKSLYPILQTLHEWGLKNSEQAD